MRLNLGCGDDRRDGWVNVDLRAEVADVVCDVRKLEHWADGEVDEILALDVLEHFPSDQTAAILAEWHRVLTPGGRLTLRVPNLYQLCRALVFYVEANVPQAVEAIITNLVGGHRWGQEGGLDAHHWGFTPASLSATLDMAGFDIDDNDLDLNMTVKARKGDR